MTSTHRYGEYEESQLNNVRDTNITYTHRTIHDTKGIGKRGCMLASVRSHHQTIWWIAIVDGGSLLAPITFLILVLVLLLGYSHFLVQCVAMLRWVVLDGMLDVGHEAVSVL